MMKRVCIYAAVFCLTLYCFFLYEDEILSGLLAAEIIYFVFSSAELLILRKKISLSFGRILPIAEKNQEVTAYVTVKNESTMPGVHFRIKIRLLNQFSGETGGCVLRGSVEKKGQTTTQFTFRASGCGNMIVEARELHLYDAFHILKIKRRTNLRQKVGILPECHILPLEITRRTREFIADAEEYSDHESGDDPSEIYQIREYREKDSVHDIHWKLSAKASELLVKEHGRPMGCVVLIWLDLEQKGERLKNRRVLPKQRQKRARTPAYVLEAAASLSLSLLEEKCVHMAAWYEKENQRIVKKRVSREEHVYELMHRLLFTESYEGAEAAESLREEAFKGESFSSTVEFDMEGRISVNGVQLHRLDGDKEPEWNKLFLTV